MGRRQLLGPPGSLNTIIPCAACKLLRRRCADECPFSPYFSPHEPHSSSNSDPLRKQIRPLNRFLVVFIICADLLGLQEVPESRRVDAANSLVYEANLRLRDPVYGSMGAIVTLQQQMQTLQAELNAVRAEILKYKFREATTSNNIIIPPSHTHDALISAGGAVPIAAPPSPLPPTPPPPAPSRPPPSSVVPSSSTSNSLYTSSTSATGYSSI
ncbi:LOB domain-containing protein 15 [Hibiscus syriacus]|uniref:LOB domain-containing protein 15 n=1 Tax=Hibiscus syriacus TaxID=106335 RepID=A0A6A2ZCP6_HIBSY|nr:LOB domain-containing protein 15 [Hibiscus syriacus]